MNNFVVTFQDLSQKSYSSKSSFLDIISDKYKDISDVIAIKVNDSIKDLNSNIFEDAKIELIRIQSHDSHEILLHSTAHLMAQAVKFLFPESKMTIGPPIENGFFYDFDVENPFTENDLENIQKKMIELSNQNYPIKRNVITRNDALKIFKNNNESYKIEILNELPKDQEITTYTQGDFVDLCRGPHLKSTGMIKNFKLLSTSGAYWRGDEKNKMLHRIYGTSFFNKKELKSYLQFIDEAKKRDHRKLGKNLSFFMFDSMSPGSPFFLPSGTIIYRELEKFIRDIYNENNFKEVITPQVFDIELWKKSGHWDLFQEFLYHVKVGEKEYSLKPMNCPGHTIIFSSELRSYRDLPYRIADFGRLHRFEKAGVISGLTRVRSFAQDDAHIFCTSDQIYEEMKVNIGMIKHVFDVFGFDHLKVELSLKPDKALGDPELWDKSEAILRDILTDQKIEFTEEEGEGAFYGPKIDFRVKDALGRYHQLSTIQLDFNLPERFDLKYVAENGEYERPIMIHRAILGSLERFIGVYIEHTGGDLPLWLAPVQAIILPISDKYNDYAYQILKILNKNNLRVKIDNRSEKIGAKIRDAELSKINYMLIVGEKEFEKQEISIRQRFRGNIGEMKLDSLLSKLLDEVNNKRRIEKSQR
tara:strand:+ start:2599 stop:4530 length:1932 start_codon:yes stop_codon:yes gene_type:complete